jgi:hypothetical protein
MIAEQGVEAASIYTKVGMENYVQSMFLAIWVCNSTRLAVFARWEWLQNRKGLKFDRSFGNKGKAYLFIQTTLSVKSDLESLTTY